MENNSQLTREKELLLPSWMVLAGLDRFAKLRPSSPLVFLLLCLLLDRRRWNPVVTFSHYFLYPVCVPRLSVLFRREALRLGWIPTLQVNQYPTNTHEWIVRQCPILIVQSFKCPPCSLSVCLQYKHWLKVFNSEALKAFMKGHCWIPWISIFSPPPSGWRRPTVGGGEGPTVHIISAHQWKGSDWRHPPFPHITSGVCEAVSKGRGH